MRRTAAVQILKQSCSVAAGFDSSGMPSRSRKGCMEGCERDELGSKGRIRNCQLATGWKDRRGICGGPCCYCTFHLWQRVAEGRSDWGLRVREGSTLKQAH
jgi:hypothetical protein